jgi:hypothetical protein
LTSTASRSTSTVGRPARLFSQRGNLVADMVAAMLG